MNASQRAELERLIAGIVRMSEELSGFHRGQRGVMICDNLSPRELDRILHQRGPVEDQLSRVLYNMGLLSNVGSVIILRDDARWQQE